MIWWLLLPAPIPAGQAQAAPNTRSPHGNLNLPCQNCHTVYGWKPIRAVPEFDHNQTRFPLRGMHEGVTCTGCHTKMVFSNVGNKCADCHADLHKGRMGAACENCHTVRGWKVSVAQINQHMNRFPLTGAHAAATCDACHKSGALSQFNTMSTACFSCHQKDYQGAQTPNHVQMGLVTTCESCHSTDTWLNAKFDHSLTNFPLTGMHTVPPRACTDCHINNNYNLTQTACVSCHLKDYNNAGNPNHAQQGFAQTCESCHTTAGWSPANFDHSKSGFPLTGMHTVPPRQCIDCHINNNYNLNQTACVSCHLKDYQNTNNPNHAQQGIPQTCEVCHSTSGWSPAQFDHSKTGFPLTGLHTVPPRTCTDCHINNNYNLNQTACVSCHLKDYQNTNNPNHAQQGFPQTCEVCHSTSGWSPAQFDHSKTGFPLTGMHTVPPRQCTDCHINNNYNLNQTACVSCHLKDYQNTNNPNHVQQGFPQTCEVCHSTSGWSPAQFDHSKTGFPLTGMHTVPPRQCTDCHINNNYNLNQTACVSCHLKDYNNTNDPPHAQAGFPQTCETCHDTTNWMDAKFDHSQTGWALTGMHTVPPRACTDCHINNNYKLNQTACVTCHLTDYNNANNPPHAQAGFPQTCETCHDTVNWMDGKFDHSQTGWALTGQHTVPPRACTDCHVNNNYKLNQTACVTCHLKDYNNTNNPPHAQVGWPTICEICHDTIAWADGKFDHSKTSFPLTNSHMVPPRTCLDCHVNNNWTGLPTDCYGCHKQDYLNTNNPNHVQAGFPTTCATCHDTKVWTDAQFNHTWFPMTHGNANGVCNTCHTNPNDYSVFTCTNCHTKTQTDQNHQGVKGYVYNSANCYQCHPSGNGGG
jgi:NMD protein affecting ribosome stability and mRNA decay